MYDNSKIEGVMESRGFGLLSGAGASLESWMSRRNIVWMLNN